MTRRADQVMPQAVVTTVAEAVRGSGLTFDFEVLFITRVVASRAWSSDCEKAPGDLSLASSLPISWPSPPQLLRIRLLVCSRALLPVENEKNQEAHTHRQKAFPEPPGIGRIGRLSAPSLAPPSSTVETSPSTLARERIMRILRKTLEQLVGKVVELSVRYLVSKFHTSDSS